MRLDWSDVYLCCYLCPLAKSVPRSLLSTEATQAVFPGVQRTLPGGGDAVHHLSQGQAIRVKEGQKIISYMMYTCVCSETVEQTEGGAVVNV